MIAFAPALRRRRPATARRAATDEMMWFDGNRNGDADRGSSGVSRFSIPVRKIDRAAGVGAAVAFYRSLHGIGCAGYEGLEVQDEIRKIGRAEARVTDIAGIVGI